MKALKQAEANGHERLLRRANWEPPKFDPEARGDRVRRDEEEKKWKPVHLDPMRPATVERRVKKQNVKVSRSFEARFAADCSARQNIYHIHADDAKTRGLHFRVSFDEIIGDRPDGLPTSLRHKIAVFYADGNKFTRIREKSGTIKDYSEFSSDVLAKQRDLMGKMLTWLKEGAERSKKAFVFTDPDEDNPDDRDKARFETLLWGGDELTFVMPAWLGIDFARRFFDEWTKEEDGTDWKSPSGEPLTFHAGLLFCHEKTAIRQARKMARIMAEDAKSTLDDYAHVLQIEAFERIALPEWEGGLSRYRNKLFALDDGTSTAGPLTLRGPEIGQAFVRIETLKQNFPRSQLYDLLRKARDEKLFRLALADPTDADNRLEGAATVYFKRMSKKPENELPKLRILGEGASLAFSLAIAAALWDYVDPFGEGESRAAAPEAVP